MIEPGWYWYDFDWRTETAAWTAFLAVNRGRVHVSKTWQSAKRVALVFRCSDGVSWTMGGRPTRAPKGDATQLADLASGPDPSPGLVELIEELTGQTIETVRASATTIRRAGAVMVWGGVGILLFALARRSR